MENEENPKINDEPESSANKDDLIKALHPLCQDFPWMSDLITSIKKAPLIETNFEISGLARCIAYKLIKENPALFGNDDAKTLPLKNFIIQLFNNVKVRKNRKESLAKILEDVYNDELRKKTSIKSKF